MNSCSDDWKGTPRKAKKLWNGLEKPPPTKLDDFFEFFQTGFDPPPYFGNYLAFFPEKTQPVWKNYKKSFNIVGGGFP